jgi:site-specific recombinase XerD
MIDLELRGGKKAVKWEEFRKQFLELKNLQVKPNTKTKYKFVLGRLTTYLSSKRITLLHELDAELLADYSRARQQDTHPTTKMPLGPEGLKNDLRILRSAFNYAIECKYIAENPVIAKSLKSISGQTRPFSKSEIALMLGNPYVSRSPKRWALISCFLYTGLRISDVSAMQKKAVDLKGGAILLRTTKRDKDVFLGLHPELRAAIEDHLANLNHAQKFSPFLFSTDTGKQDWPQSLDAKLRRIFIHCGVEKGHAHRFRDTFAVGLLEQGASLYDVSKLLGTTVAVCELHYAPYVGELRARAKTLVGKLSFAPEKSQLEHSG